MPTTLKVTIGNKQRSFKFTNEEDAAQAETMLEEEKAFNAEAVQAAIAAKSDLEGQIAELQAQLAEHDQHLQAAKQQIEDLLTPAAQEAMANEVVEQKEAEEVIVEAETDNIEDESEAETEKEEFGNALKACKTLAERRAVAVARVMNMRGVKTDEWTQEAIDGAFKVLVLNAKEKSSAKVNSTRTLNGKLDVKDRQEYNKVVNAKPGQQNNRDRVLAPMRTKNSQGKASSKNKLVELLSSAIDSIKGE